MVVAASPEIGSIEETFKYARFKLKDIRKLVTENPLKKHTEEDKENPHKQLIRIMRNPDYFYFTCKLLFNIELMPFQCVILKELWTRPFPMLVASRGAGKSFMLAVYALLRATLTPGSKVVIVGAAFRQSKVIFEYIDTIWQNSPVFRDFVGNESPGPKRDVDRCYMKIGNSFIVAIPLGDGTKIRGLRATHILSDEFASIPEEIFENVVAGFASVRRSPAEGVQHEAVKELMIEMGFDVEEDEESDGSIGTGNQSVLSGTAYYEFNHFAKYWKRYKSIIHSQGDERKLMEVFEGAVPEGFNWKDFSIMRIPVHALPKGFMDERQVARSKATVHSGIYQMEFGAVFSNDSAGFFKRSLIESCVASDVKPIMLPSGEITFPASLRGNAKGRYVFGIDTASENDNFCIVVLEIHPDHRRIVYCWTTTRNTHKQRVKEKFTEEQNFYNYCSRKIRDLMKVFPCERIMMDSQGGGIAVYECLHDSDKIDTEKGEQAIWEVVDEEKRKDTDGYQGLHILEMVNFADAKWTWEANHGLRKDFEDKICLFPHYDGLSVEIALHEDRIAGRVYDTLDDCVWEIEELKDELATIIHTQTPSGRDKWDTPEVKLPGNKKGRLRKDRYSALVMANMGARTAMRAPPEVERPVVGGFAHQIETSKNPGALYVGPAWFTNNVCNGIGTSVKRKR